MSEEQNQVEESPQLSEHDQEMLEVASQSEEQTNQELRSDNENLLLAGKYKDVAELEKAYTELQSKMGQESTEAQEDTPTEETPEVTDSVDEAQETVESKGIDFDGLNSEYSENGELSSETYTSLEQAGLSKEVVDSYIQGQEAIQQQQINALQSEVGGEAEYQSMIEWAASNLSESETEAFNATLDSEEGARFAIQGLNARYKAANPNLIGGNRTSGASSSSRGFTTKSDMMEAMSSPKYKTDHTYRAEVQRKLALSTFL
jgi:hypothetical protein